MEGRGEHCCCCRCRRLVTVEIPDENDPKFVTKVSSALVATIQDAKQTISQFEYLFSRLLYPKLLNSGHSALEETASASAQDHHLRQLELQMRQVCHERDQARRDCHALKDELLVEKQTRHNVVEDLTNQFLVEKQRRRDLSAAYKRLKSENNFLRGKCGATPITMEEGESDSLTHGGGASKIAAAEAGRIPVTFPVPDELHKVKTEIDSMENSEDDNGDDMKISSSSDIVSGELSNVKNDIEPMDFPKDEEGDRSNQVTISRAPNAPALTRVNLGASAGSKRPASGWRDTRCRQSPGGADPHDDFLDTPYENIRDNLHRVMNDNLHSIAAQISKDTTSCSSDDETQDMKAESKKQQVEASRPAAKGFKYVEPVRKKSEREGLSGFDCKQCKKFYDVVLSEAAGNGGEVEKRSLRCEHHEGVSRHRYRYVPPMTPEGFWNIGFDSEI